MQNASAGPLSVPLLPAQQPLAASPALTLIYHDVASGQTVTSGQLLAGTQVEEAHSTTSSAASDAVASPGGTEAPRSDEEIENDKKVIFRHPLFPLMALLFEKCEQATRTPECPPSDDFDIDIQAFVHHQEQDNNPFFSDDPELDALMVKTIQVLRIHLLELEKVSELCKDFCTRYIACLKGKLQSENLLCIDNIDGDDIELDPTDLDVKEGVGGVVLQSVTLPAADAGVGLAQGQIVSGGTVYQMVQTPQGVVAQPIQIQSPLTPTVHQSVIQGSTPMSHIGLVRTSSGAAVNEVPAPAALPPSPSVCVVDEDDPLRKKSKRGVLPAQSTKVMKSWLYQHIVHPYPTEDEKRQIAAQTNLSLLQVNNWFINARRRILQPMLDASNPSGVKAKKPKSQGRLVQRFWPDSLANLQPSSPPPAAAAPAGATDDSSQPLMLPSAVELTLAPLTAALCSDDDDDDDDDDDGEDDAGTPSPETNGAVAGRLAGN